MIPPNEAPALKMPCASARSREGNQSALALAAPGQLPASLTPSVARRKTSSGIERTSACAAIDRDQTTTERVKPIRVPLESTRRTEARAGGKECGSTVIIREAPT